MHSVNTRAALLAAGVLLAASACNAGGAVPSGGSGGGSGSSVSAPAATNASPSDTTSILKLLKKDVEIGSTVDPTNGDTGPRAISIVSSNNGKLKKGDLLVCNFSDSAGKAGSGTTIEMLADAAGSTPSTFVQSSTIEGCDGAAIAAGDQVYATGLTSKKMAWINQSGAVKKTYGAPIADPLGDVYAPRLYEYAPEYIFVGDAQTGAIVSLSKGGYGTHNLLEVVSGFGVNKGSGWSALGPSNLAYRKKGDTLYVVDGADNTVVSIQHASDLLQKDEIVVQPGGKTFKCAHAKTTCATLVKSGKPLDAPEAVALLPNGNLVVANTQGGNTLVEMTPTGQILDTEVVDKSKTAAIFGLLATGSSDSDTALFYTDTNTNTLQELEQ